MKNYIAEFSQYCYKMGKNETNLAMFCDKLPYLINLIINEKYVGRLKKAYVIDILNSGSLI